MDESDRHRGGPFGTRQGLAAALALLLGLSVALTLASPAAAKPLFGPPGAAAVPGDHLFDLGVTDYNDDGLLDMFTANHKFHPALLLNDGQGNFSDQTADGGFSPSPDFPGYEDLTEPAMSQPGIYVYASDPRDEKLPGLIHIRSIGVQAQGSFSFGADSATVQRADGARTQQGRTASGQPIIYVALDPGAAIDIQASHIDLPIAVSFGTPAQTEPTDPPTIFGPPPPGPAPPPPPIFVGGRAAVAPPNFVLNLRDRHGYAFADLASDGATDVFAVAGGLGGAIKLPGYVTLVQDELLVRQAGYFSNVSAGSGLAKGGCRARQSAAVDVDDDGQLDLFETCEGEPPRIFRQQSRGRFTNLPSPDSVGTTYRWADLGGPRPSLLAAEPRGTKVWGYTSTGWKLQQSVHDNARKGQVAQYALNDYDNDGDLDVLAVSRSGNTLLNNSRGLLEKVPLKGTGIPLRSVAASFVDYDNDGRIDLDLIPQGLLHGLGDTRFKSVRRLRTAPSGAGITNWFDYDNDGLRDPVIVTGNAEFAQEMTVTRSRNLGPGGHWLEVNLHGQGGNREAIGARVAIRSGNQHLYGWVGQSDDSHHSQGHYRLYFGLGGHAQVGEMIVKWPNGNSTRFGAFPADQVVDINQP